MEYGMNYKKIYDNIVNFRKHNAFDGYVESHHIIPKCLGGDDSSDNLVNLSAKEHFICHLLLTKIYRNDKSYSKLIHAFLMMLVSSKNQERYLTSKKYEILRAGFSERMSSLQGGENNSQYGTLWISNCDLKISKKINKSEILPEGWIKGRNAWKKINKKIERENLLNNKKEQYVNKAISLWEEFKNGEYNSINEFVKIKKCGCLRGITRQWMKYVPEYKNVAGQGKLIKKYL
jgi:hypothetical protein